jgi:anoctamin-10
VPTIVFAASVPTLLEIYHSYAIHVTTLEHHKDNSTYDASFTTQRFALSTLVSYLGLVLSAFVYVPFGAEVLGMVQLFLYGAAPAAQKFLHANSDGFWERDVTKATTKLDTRRLYDQVFASTVTGQIMNAFEEVGWPFVTRAFQAFRGGNWSAPFYHGLESGGSSSSSNGLSGWKSSSANKEKKPDDSEEEFLERVRKEVALGVEYDVFEDYSEMVTQFGYVAMWSSIWPLAPGTLALHIYPPPESS